MVKIGVLNVQRCKKNIDTLKKDSQYQQENKQQNNKQSPRRIG